MIMLGLINVGELSNKDYGTPRRKYMREREQQMAAQVRLSFV